MSFVILASGPAHLPRDQQIHEQFVKHYDPEANDGGGYAEFTLSPVEALKFDSYEAAFKTVMQIPWTRPLRDDGLPNRPLRAFSISIEQLP